MEERVENHIKQLHAQLHITPAEQPQWDQFAQVMRENARDMDQAFTQRAQQYSATTAMQNMQSYEQIAEAHAHHLQKLVPAFDTLYNAMPEQQKKLTDQVFRDEGHPRGGLAGGGRRIRTFGSAKAAMAALAASSVVAVNFPGVVYSA